MHVALKQSKQPLTSNSLFLLHRSGSYRFHCNPPVLMNWHLPKWAHSFHTFVNKCRWMHMASKQCEQPLTSSSIFLQLWSRPHNFHCNLPIFMNCTGQSEPTIFITRRIHTHCPSIYWDEIFQFLPLVQSSTALKTTTENQGLPCCLGTLFHTLLHKDHPWVLSPWCGFLSLHEQVLPPRFPSLLVQVFFLLSGCSPPGWGISWVPAPLAGY